ncbi:Aste57867_8756 [Aphanomyces stellatus]|uniref:Aste57867_8756 protein n=1 Tax=Aphanomyces stellatus TaxID=120398 RepID=A0A485KL24_9STRA|nr:hypothetical protein As57867_008722 [Aphanomyces stellatus]VFT85642.1 Aste57867_8756 [Aphanomyces stellatus]
MVVLECHHGAQAALAKVRAEGDYILIKIEMEKKELETTVAEIAAAKAQIAALHAAKRDDAPVGPTTDLHKHVQLLQHHEARQNSHLCEDLTKIAAMRQCIDDARRVRKDAAAADAEAQRKAALVEARMAATMVETNELKHKDAALVESIRRVQIEMEEDAARFLAEKKLLSDVLHKPTPVARVTQKPVVEYSKKNNLSWLRARNRVVLVKRTESLETKKDLLDTLLATTKSTDVRVFLKDYLRMEDAKADVCKTIEHQSNANAALQAAIRDLEMEKRKLQGHDVHSVDGLNPYCEDIRNDIHRSRDVAAKLMADARHLDSTAKGLFEPLQQLYDLTHPSPTAASDDASTMNASNVLARLASIEERVTEKVLSKIAAECAAGGSNKWQDSASLVRLLQARGVLKSAHDPSPNNLPSIGVDSDDDDDAADEEDDEGDPPIVNDDDDDIKADTSAVVHPTVIHSSDLWHTLTERHAAAAAAAAVTASHHNTRRTMIASHRQTVVEKELASESAMVALKKLG